MSQRQKVGVKYSKLGVNKNSATKPVFSCHCIVGAANVGAYDLKGTSRHLSWISNLNRDDIEQLHVKTNKMTVHPAKAQISLGICPVWLESSLSVQWVAKDWSFLHADSEDSDQTGQMPRLIRVFAGCTCHFVGFVMRRLNYCDRILWHKQISH